MSKSEDDFEQYPGRAEIYGLREVGWFKHQSLAVTGFLDAIVPKHPAMGAVLASREHPNFLLCLPVPHQGRAL